MFHITRNYPGSWPVQAEGLINFTDQAFYFRARNGVASLTISPDAIVTQDRDACAYVEMEAPFVTVENASLSPAQIRQMISDLIKIYLKEAVKAHAVLFRTGDMDRIAG